MGRLVFIGESQKMDKQVDFQFVYGPLLMLS
jgi:hypothetical protein